MRYAEVLLLAAEANLNAGNQQLADNDLNEVRTRAKVATKTGITLDDIINEKRLELCFECTRYQDLIRWGLGEKFMGTQGLNCPLLDSNGNVTYKNYNSEGKYGFKERNKLLPFPSTEVTLNANIVQNTGW
jgi:SusD family.